MFLIIFAGNLGVDIQHWTTWLPFAVSVFSAAFGMSKYFAVGPCRLIPYDKIGLGFFFVFLNIATCLCGKAVVLVDNVLDRGYAVVYIWILLSVLPQAVFVS